MQIHHIEEVLKTLQPIGLKLNKDISPADLMACDIFQYLELDSKTDGEFYTNFVYLMSCFKDVHINNQLSFADHCDQLWWCDGETDSSVDYGDFIIRLNKMSGNKFEFTDVENIDLSMLEEEELEDTSLLADREIGHFGTNFKLKGKTYHWMFEGEDDWLDFNFFDRFIKLIAAEYGSYEAEKYLSFGYSQGMVVCYIEHEHQPEFIRLLTYNSKTRVDYFLPKSSNATHTIGEEPKIHPKPNYNFSEWSYNQLNEAIEEVYEELKYSNEPELLTKSQLLSAELKRRESPTPPDNIKDKLLKFLRKW